MALRCGGAEGSWKVRRAKLLRLVKDVFGHDGFRGKQEEAVREVLDGNDALVVMPTGGGKSLCYQLPAVASEGVCIVVSPLIALTEDQLRGLREKGVDAASLTSASASQARAAAVINDLQGRCSGGDGAGASEDYRGGIGAAEGDGEGGARPRTKLLYVTPEKLAKSGSLTTTLRRLASRGLVSLLAIDEAHCVSTWGHDFRPAYLKIEAFRKRHLPGVPCLALTATATAEVCADIMKQLGIGEGSRVLKTSFNRPEIHLSVRYKDAMDGKALQNLVGFLKERQGQSGIVYCHKRDTAEGLADALNRSMRDGPTEKEFLAMPYHGKMADAERSDTQAKFMSGEVDVITGSVAFGMGIDKSDVRFVVHWDLPKSVEGLYQELGRAGRDGAPAVSVVYHSQESAGLQTFLAKKPKPIAGDLSAAEKKAAEKRQGKAALKAITAVKAVVEYCEKAGCRREALLGHFGEGVGGGTKGKGKEKGNASTKAVPCNGTCDWCGGDRERVRNDLAKLSAARAGSGWMGVRSLSTGADGGKGKAGPPKEGGWDAKSYYRLAGEDREGRESSEGDEGTGTSDDDSDSGFDARGPGAAGGGARFPKTAEVSMAKFGKEEDYWDRLERLEAEADGKSTKSSAPSNSFLSKTRHASSTSHGNPSRKQHPKVRSVQQPMMPARSQPKKTPQARPLTGPLAGSATAPPREDSSGRRSLRSFLPPPPTAVVKKSQEGKSLRDVLPARPTEVGKRSREEESGGKKKTPSGARATATAAAIDNRQTGISRKTGRRAAVPQPKPWTPDQQPAIQPLPPLPTVPQPQSLAAAKASRQTDRTRPQPWTPDQPPPIQPLPPPPPVPPPQFLAAAKASRQTDRPLVTDLLAHILHPSGSGNPSSDGGHPKISPPGGNDVRRRDGRRPRISPGANIASSASRRKQNVTGTLPAKHAPSTLPRGKISTQSSPGSLPKADKGSGAVVDLLAQMLGNRAEPAKKLGAGRGGVVGVSHPAASLSSSFASAKGSGGGAAGVSRSAVSFVTQGTADVGGKEKGAFPKRGADLLGVRKREVVVARDCPSSTGASAGASAGTSTSDERRSSSSSSSALAQQRLGGAKRLKADANYRCSVSSSTEDIGTSAPSSRRADTPTKNSDHGAAPTRKTPLVIRRKFGSSSDRGSNRGSSGSPPLRGGGYRALAMMSTADGPVNEPAGARAERRRTPPLTFEPSRARLLAGSPMGAENGASQPGRGTAPLAGAGAKHRASGCATPRAASSDRTGSGSDSPLRPRGRGARRAD